MIHQQILIETFLLTPTQSIFRYIERKDLALSELDKYSSSTTSLFRWKQSMRDIRAVDIVRQAVKENNIDVVRELVTTLRDDDFNNKVAFIAAREGNTTILSFVLKEITDVNWYKLNINAARGGQQQIIDKYSYNMRPTALMTQMLVKFQSANTEQRQVIVDQIRKMKEREITTNNLIACAAAKGGHTSVVNYCINKNDGEHWDVGANDWNKIACAAAKGGHTEIIDMMIDRGATDWNSIASSAAWYGYTDIVYRMIDLGADDWNSIAKSAAQSGNKKLVDDMIDRGANNFTTIAKYAINRGYDELMHHVCKRGSTTISANNAAFYASEHGYKFIVDKYVRKGANNYKQVANCAVIRGHKPIVEDMLKLDPSIDISEFDFDYHADCRLYINDRVIIS